MVLSCVNLSYCPELCQCVILCPLAVICPSLPGPWAGRSLGNNMGEISRRGITKSQPLLACVIPQRDCTVLCTVLN